MPDDLAMHPLEGKLGEVAFHIVGLVTLNREPFV